MIDIYWANALFSEADRRFNADCARRLRDAGYTVFLPQETPFNEAASPTATEIFRGDTTALLDSRLLIACLDQETIDSGVACELGAAYAYGMPMVGLYTDIRQNRNGRGRMYKNLYVIGAVETVGEIVGNVDDLLQVIPQYLSPHTSGIGESDVGDRAASHYGTVATDYSDFVSRLEDWYEPRWQSAATVSKWLQQTQAMLVLEMGCGPGDLGRHICTHFPAISYLGYDKSPQMIGIAKGRSSAQRCKYTADLSEVVSHGSRNPFDFAVASFTLHDHPRGEQTLMLLTRCVRAGGHILIIDLSSSDLPKLTHNLKMGLACPAAPHDPRLDPAWLASAAVNCGLALVQCEMALPGVRFPSADELDRYMEVFGIYAGMDLPLGLRSADLAATRELVRIMIRRWAYPFRDQRAFVTCMLRK